VIFAGTVRGIRDNQNGPAIFGTPSWDIRN
jgi:hypothetical protein